MNYQSAYVPMDDLEKVNLENAPDFILEEYWEVHNFFSDYPDIQAVLGIYRNVEPDYWRVMFDDDCTEEQWNLADRLIKESNER